MEKKEDIVCKCLAGSCYENNIVNIFQLSVILDWKFSYFLWLGLRKTRTRLQRLCLIWEILFLKKQTWGADRVFVLVEMLRSAWWYIIDVNLDCSIILFFSAFKSDLGLISAPLLRLVYAILPEKRWLLSGTAVGNGAQIRPHGLWNIS